LAQYLFSWNITIHLIAVAGDGH